MGSKTKKIQSFGKYGAGFGTRVRKRYNKIERTQRKDQPSPFVEGGKAKRIAVGIWKCLKTGKIFAGPAYSLRKE